MIYILFIVIPIYSSILHSILSTSYALYLGCILFQISYNYRESPVLLDIANHDDSCTLDWRLFTMIIILGLSKNPILTKTVFSIQMLIGNPLTENHFSSPPSKPWSDLRTIVHRNMRCSKYLRFGPAKPSLHGWLRTRPSIALEVYLRTQSEHFPNIYG